MTLGVFCLRCMGCYTLRRACVCVCVCVCISRVTHPIEVFFGRFCDLCLSLDEEPPQVVELADAVLQRLGPAGEEGSPRALYR